MMMMGQVVRVVRGLVTSSDVRAWSLAWLPDIDVEPPLDIVGGPLDSVVALDIGSSPPDIGPDTDE